MENASRKRLEADRNERQSKAAQANQRVRQEDEGETRRKEILHLQVAQKGGVRIHGAPSSRKVEFAGPPGEKPVGETGVSPDELSARGYFLTAAFARSCSIRISIIASRT